jgi:dolichol-phosphate mannosyltransferase
MAKDVSIAVEAAPSGPLVVAADGERRVSIVVPTYNEAENVPEFLKALAAVLDDAAPGSWEIVVVDDDSPDGTCEVAASLTGLHGLRVVRRRAERGLARAVIRGMQAATGDVLGTINADFQHPPEVLGPMIRAIRDVDMAVASRYVEGGGLGNWRGSRRATSKGAHWLGQLLLPDVFRRLSDPLSGCYVVRRSAIAGVELAPLGYKTLIEFAARGRIASIRECPYQMRDRARGASKAGGRQTVEYVRQLFRLRRAPRPR